MIYRVLINGTDEPPLPASWGLEVNPLPQIGRAEYDYAERQLAELGRRGCTPHRIKELLAEFHPEFVKLILDAYKPGVLVRLKLEIPDKLLGIEPQDDRPVAR